MLVTETCINRNVKSSPRAAVTRTLRRIDPLGGLIVDGNNKGRVFGVDDCDIFRCFFVAVYIPSCNLKSFDLWTCSGFYASDTEEEANMTKVSGVVFRLLSLPMMNLYT